ncbi:hypothetical protein [Candidatus Aalborgicola defluviihabitans]|jgi:hypothetical protein|uniref:hypothetical protein n=1 Tax=Candidatus Aalborgicola defluviihabitans TaxID=3386187 RepID=UPI001D3CB1A9|nr:hypothetical protein [Burkholderiales bacterium]MBK6568486.1 hypothetical protein [Burkholderiales bacterium]MBK7314520.1 hypothetical protein [Burkholderiales bacterium]MBL0244241.1 hypothetical protein [Rhodoferax sp.]
MANQKLATVTNELIESYGNTAKNVINAYRVGNERAVVFMDQAFVSAIGKTGTRLSAKTRHNAVAAEKKLTGYYAKGVELTSDNADLMVNKAVELAGKGLVQVAANAGRFEKSIGVTTLSTLATAAVPAAKAVTKVAAQIEAKSGVLASKIAGKTVKAKVATAKRAVAKKVVRARKAA